MQIENSTAPAGFEGRQQRGAGRSCCVSLQGEKHQGWLYFLKHSCCSHAGLFLTWNHFLLSEETTSLLLKGQAGIESEPKKQFFEEGPWLPCRWWGQPAGCSGWGEVVRWWHSSIEEKPLSSSKPPAVAGTFHPLQSSAWSRGLLPCIGEQENPSRRICSFAPLAWLSAGLCSMLSPSHHAAPSWTPFLPSFLPLPPLTPPLQPYPPAVPLPQRQRRLSKTALTPCENTRGLFAVPSQSRSL